MPPLIKKLGFEIRCFVAADPRWGIAHSAFIAWGKFKIVRKGKINPREAHVQPDTDLVIDGYQGSANSFATAAFKHAQRSPVRLAHHLHAPVQVIRGVRLRLPVVVTVREPHAAALSLIRRWPSISAAQALRWYIRYYRALIPYANALVVSPFEMTTRSLDVVFGEVNERFGTRFDLFVHTPEAVAAVRGLRVEMEAAKAEAAKKEKAHEFETVRARALLDEAGSVYQEFIRAGNREGIGVKEGLRQPVYSATELPDTGRAT